MASGVYSSLSMLPPDDIQVNNSPNKRPKILPPNINLPPLLINSLADLHGRNKVRHEHPNIRFREKASWADPPSESKYGLNLLTGFTCHLFRAKEPLWVERVR